MHFKLALQGSTAEKHSPEFRENVCVVRAWDTGSLPRLRSAGDFSGVSAVPSGKWGKLRETRSEVSVWSDSISLLSLQSQLTDQQHEGRAGAVGAVWDEVNTWKVCGTHCGPRPCM